jgi:hypothetical protein
VKHQYFGDVNDYLKYGLLRELIRADLKLGVCWMLTPDDSSGDGRKTDYLKKPTLWRGHDSELFDHLRESVLHEGVRNVAAIQQLIPADYVSSLVPEERQARVEWMRAALQGVRPDVWFFDPDNGIEVSSVASLTRRSTKHVYWDELEAA